MQSKTEETLEITDYNTYLTYLQKNDIYYHAVANSYALKLLRYWDSLYDK